MHLYKNFSTRCYIALTATVKFCMGSPKTARNQTRLLHVVPFIGNDICVILHVKIYSDAMTLVSRDTPGWFLHGSPKVEPLQIAGVGFLQARCPFCHPPAVSKQFG